MENLKVISLLELKKQMFSKKVMAVLFTMLKKKLSNGIMELKRGGPESKEVCAFKFTDQTETSYRLKTFASAEAAKNAGYLITHRHKCGQCSSLKDLAMYIAKPNLTTPVRNCVQKPGLGLMKQCLIKVVGFSEYCAEAWAYNGANTKSWCKKRCMKDYGGGSAAEGAFNVLAGKYTKYGEGNTYVDEEGKLSSDLVLLVMNTVQVQVLNIKRLVQDETQGLFREFREQIANNIRLITSPTSNTFVIKAQMN